MFPVGDNDNGNLYSNENGDESLRDNPPNDSKPDDSQIRENQLQPIPIGEDKTPGEGEKEQNQSPGAGEIGNSPGIELNQPESIQIQSQENSQKEPKNKPEGPAEGQKRVPKGESVIPKGKSFVRLSADERKKGRKKRGRPIKFDEERRKEFINLIAGGNYVETAAAFVGLTKETIYEWLRIGRNERRGKYKEFADAVRKAQATAEAFDVQTITRAAAGDKDSEGKILRPGDWKASAWRLERKFPKRWGIKMTNKVVGDPKQPVGIDLHNVDLKKLTDQQLFEKLGVSGWEELQALEAQGMSPPGEES